MSLPSENVNDLQDEDSNAALLVDSNRDLISKRKVQWNDRNGKDLTSVWKFQPRYLLTIKSVCCFSINRF